MTGFSFEDTIKAREPKWSKYLKDFPLITDIWEESKTPSFPEAMFCIEGRKRGHSSLFLHLPGRGPEAQS